MLQQRDWQNPIVCKFSFSTQQANTVTVLNFWDACLTDCDWTNTQSECGKVELPLLYQWFRFRRISSVCYRLSTLSYFRSITADDPDSFCVRFHRNKGVKMGHGLLLIVLLIAATALTSGEYSSAFMAKATPPTILPAKSTTTHTPPTTTHNPNTTTHNPNTTTHNPPTTTHNPPTTTHNPPTTTHNPNTTTHNPNTTTHNPPTTTHNPNTTTHNPNTTTHNPPTTTHNPPTTTHNPNSTTHNPNSTTHNPNSTTHAPTPPPTPAPTSPTKLTVGNYNVTDGKGKICILAKLEIGIRVNTSKVNGTFIVQPSITTPSGKCENKTAYITLGFKEGSLTLKFYNNETAKKVYVDYVEYKLTYAFTKGELVTYSGKNKSIELFAAAQGHSYSCSAETVFMGNGVSLDLSNYRLQAFNIKNDQFGAPDLCKSDKPDYRVPIAVGIILIILIIIVVIAYLISRKRRSDGYQSL